jgi:hypothetical protein
MAGPFERDPQGMPRSSRLADPTRDIRLPPLPGRPGPELPSEWERLRSEREAAAATAADTGAPGAVAPTRSAPGTGLPAGASADTTPPDPMADQPTDQLGRPAQGPRDRTLTFRGTAAERWAAGHPATPDPAWSSVPAGPAPVVAPRRRPEEKSRRWPWVLLTLVPILVIVVTGVWLLLLMQGG